MSIKIQIRRFFSELKKGGICKTSIKTFNYIYANYLKSKKLVIYCVDLQHDKLKNDFFNKDISIQRINDLSQLTRQELDVMERNINKNIIFEKFNKRFKKNCSLWLVKYKNEVAGCGWTIQKNPMKPYLLPLLDNDVHLFDYIVFPKFRGKGINSYLVNYILFILKKENVRRAYIETLIWNVAEIRSLKKTQFKKIGVATKFQIFKKNIIVWDTYE